MEEEVRARGGIPLEVKVYADTSPLFWVDFKILVTSTPITQTAAVGAAVGFVLPVWASILIIALAIVGIIVAITLAIKTITGYFKSKPGLHDVKPAWGKETLIKTIIDAEQFWERPPTPPETLDGMSEPELRDLLDKIAEEEVPTGTSWLPLAIVAGVAIIGVGSAVALSRRKKK